MPATYRDSISSVASPADPITVDYSTLTHSAGDVLVLFVFGYVSFGSPSGATLTWTRRETATIVGAFGATDCGELWTATSDGSSDSFTMAHGLADQGSWAMVSVQDATEAGIVSTIATGAWGTTDPAVASSVSPGAAGSLLLMGCGAWPSTDQVGSWTLQSALVEREDWEGWDYCAVGTEERASSGATGTRTFETGVDMGGTDAWIAISVAIATTAAAPAYPVVEGTAESSVNTAGTSHAVTLPASIAATDMVLITMDIGSTSATLNALTDWEELLDEAAANGLKILRYIGTGVPGNPTFTSSANTRSASIAWRISGAEKSIAPQIGTTATGTSATPDPPSVAPADGVSKDYLVIAFAGMAGEEADDDTWGNTPPTNYLPSPPLQKSCGTVGASLGGLIVAASRQITTGSAQDPGTFGVDVSAAWRAQTIIVHPTGASVPRIVIPVGAVRRAASW